MPLLHGRDRSVHHRHQRRDVGALREDQAGRGRPRSADLPWLDPRDPHQADRPVGQAFVDRMNLFGLL